jgi:AcrR family transcriptional regulator
MARKTPDDRLARLVETATTVFIAQGYRRTQMADVAEALGVAKGTVYLYVESKEALFDLVARAAAGDRSLIDDPKLPLKTPKPAATLRFARAQLLERHTLPALTAALRRKRVADFPSELEAIVRELYRTLRDNRIGIKLLDRCASDYPELAAIWYAQGRDAVLSLLTVYLDARARAKLLRRPPDIAVAARFILETAVTWAVHRHWDAHPQRIDDETAEETVVHFIRNALVRD